MKIRQETIPHVLSIASLAVVAIGLIITYFHLIASGSEWGRAFIHGVWLIFSTALISLVLSAYSLYSRVTWYGIIIGLGITGLFLTTSYIALLTLKQN